MTRVGAVLDYENCCRPVELSEAEGAGNTTRPLTHPSDYSRGGLAVDATQETWRSVVGYEGSYEVSNLGRVRSLDRTITTATGVRRRLRGRVLTAWRSDQFNHQSVSLGHSYRDHHQVHVLVLTAFVGVRPRRMEGCHNDGDPTNNHLANLRWDTASSNQRDRVVHGNHHNSSRDCCVHGHEFTPENTSIRIRSGPRYVTPSRSRVCKTCQQNRRRAANEKKREQRRLRREDRCRTRSG